MFIATIKSLEEQKQVQSEQADERHKEPMMAIKLAVEESRMCMAAR